MKEIWKDIEESPNYMISNLGRIYSKPRTNSKGGILKGSIDGSGYRSFNIRHDGKRKNKRIHLLVAKYFIPNPNNYKVINHIDHNKLNNKYNNLEWCTQKHNIREAFKMNRYGRKMKFTDEDVLKIRNSTKSISELSKIYKVSYQNIYDVIKKKVYKNI